MQDLTVIGVADGSLLVSSEDGTEYTIAIDDTLTSTIRQATPLQGAARRVAPREIQAHIRGGMSADEVAAITGAPLDVLQRFEGPVLAEREFIVEQALNVSVHTAVDIDPLGGGSTFGSVIRERLQNLGAAEERWASWKEPEGGWIVKLSFTASDIDHDARWRFEPKRAALAPINGEAHTLSQQGELPGGLIPRLRAVGGDERAADASRFDSGAFDLRQPVDARDDSQPADRTAFVRPTESSPEVAAAAIKRSPAEVVESSQTADLLEALRRRRGEREAAGSWDDDALADHPSSGGAQQAAGARLIDVPLDAFDDEPTPTAPQPMSGQQRASGRKGRTAMPSWDEIVFGARSDDDPA